MTVQFFATKVIQILSGSKQQMLELEDGFVDGSLEIPGQGSEEPSNVDDQNMDLVANGPEVARKQRASTDDNSRAAFADANGVRCRQEQEAEQKMKSG